jgi:hypothetical protein
MTISELQALALGYLSGADLTRFASANLLIKQWNVDNTVLLVGVNTAIKEIQTAARTRYDLSAEYTKEYGDPSRDLILVKLTAIAAVRNIMGDVQNIGETLMYWCNWLDTTLKALRNGQFPLQQPGVAPVTITDPITQQPVTYVPDSRAETVRSSFLTLG